MASLCSWLAFAAVLVSASAPAENRLAGRVVIKETFAPNRQDDLSIIDLGNFSGGSIPSGADRVPLTINGVRFDGDPCPVPGVTERLIHALSAKGLTIADLYLRIHEMEKELSAAGYVLTRVTVPPQRVAPGGAVVIKIINGHIEKIDVQALPAAIREPVTARLAKLLSKRLLRRADIERSLLVAGDMGGLTLRSTFAPGEEPGGIKLIVDGSFKRVSGLVGIDNMTNAAVGGWEANTSISLNNPFGFGEQLYFAYQGDLGTALDSNARMRTFAGGALIPLGNDGLTISPELAWAGVVPRPQNAVPNSQNEMARASLRISYPLVRELDRTVVTYTAIEAINQRINATDFNVTLLSDSYLALRSGFDIQSLVSTDLTLFGSGKLSQGLGGIGSVLDGGGDAPSTHEGAKTDFTKVNAVAGITKAIETVTASATVRGQTSFGKPLFNAEQLELDGADAISSLSPGAYAVDEGATLRTELGQSFTVQGAIVGVASPYIFAAFGVGSTYSSTAGVSTTTRAAGTGAGVRLKVQQSNSQMQPLSLAVEFGHSWIDAETKIQTSKAYFTLGWSF